MKLFSSRYGAAFALALIAGVSACSDSTTAVGPSTETAHVRIVNSMYQGATAATATPLAIDYLIDGSMAQPGVTALPGNSMTTGLTANGYQDVGVGVHSFMARSTGKSTTADSLYTTASNLPWVPRQYLTTNVFYTIIVAGIIPLTSPINNNTVPFTALVDDPFPPIKVNGTYQARFRVMNAAPFAATSGNGSTVTVFITPGATPPATLTTISSLGTAGYRNASAYLNVDAGTYVLTVAVIGSNAILSQSIVNFAAGEVRTFLLQSTGFLSPAGSANHKLTSILDQQY